MGGLLKEAGFAVQVPGGSPEIPRYSRGSGPLRLRIALRRLWGMEAPGNPGARGRKDVRNIWVLFERCEVEFAA